MNDKSKPLSGNLNQRTYLCDALMPVCQGRYTYDQLWSMSECITVGMYRYLLALIYNHRSDKLDEELSHLIKTQ
jgi:hypothetical protein